jgi:hypothetical protein
MKFLVKILTVMVLVVLCMQAHAETVYVKYRGPVDLIMKLSPKKAFEDSCAHNYGGLY